LSSGAPGVAVAWAPAGSTRERERERERRGTGRVGRPGRKKEVGRAQMNRKDFDFFK
jgi:hypothetical protein